MSADDMNAKQMSGKLISHSDNLINAVYDLALDPQQFYQFTHAWDEFINSVKGPDVDSVMFNKELNTAMSRHFERAFLLMEKIGRNAQADVSVDHYLANRQTPAFAVNKAGQVEAVNERASEVFGFEQSARVNALGIEQLIHADSHDALAEGLLKTVAGERVVPVLVLLRNRIPALFVLKGLANSGTIVVDIAGTTWNEQANQILMTNYGLSVNECEIVALLYQGLSAKQVANARQRSEETVRTQIRSILKKMRCDSQVKLMRLVTSLAFLSTEEAESDWFSDACPMQRIVLNDGRVIEYYDVGSRAAPALVVFHGMIHTPELPEPIIKALLQANFRVIGLCRAGYGHSSPPPDWGDAPQGAADDLDFLMSRLGVARASLLSLMAGSLYAYQFAASYPQRAYQVICLSGTVSNIGQDDMARLPSGARALATAAKHFPKLLTFLVRTAVALIDQGDYEKIISMVYRRSSIDLKLAKRPEIHQKLSRALRFTAYQGYAPYTNGSIALASDHPGVVEKIGHPVVLIHGRQDGMQPIDQVRDFVKQAENRELHEIDGAGQLAMFAKPERIAQLLITALHKHQSEKHLN